MAAVTTELTLKSTCLYALSLQHFGVEGGRVVAEIQIVAVLVLPDLVNVLEGRKVIYPVHDQYYWTHFAIHIYSLNMVILETPKSLSPA